MFCVFNDVTGQNIAQTDNESYCMSQPLQAITVGDNLVPPFLGVRFSVMYEYTYVC